MKPAFGLLGRLRSKISGTRPEPYLVNLGCGACFHPDWVNFDLISQSPDVIEHDLRTRLPLDDASCAVVYHSNVLEHLPHAFAPLFLKECHRVLVPGGVLRVVVPDLETIARLYLKNLDEAITGDAEAASRYEWLMLELIDQMVREESGGEMLKYWQLNPMPAEKFVIERVGREVLQFIEPYRAKTRSGAPVPPAAHRSPKPEEVTRFRTRGEVHKWMYDRWSLRGLLEKADFHEIRVCAANESQIPDFARYGLDLNVDGSVRKPDSLFVEARKRSVT
jgi:predicted SAM-dependent methyltransferase